MPRDQGLLFGDTGVEGRDHISPCGLYRYWLELVWEEGLPNGLVLFALLNPSKATATVTDPTRNRVVDFGQRWGFSGLVIVNLFAYRSTKPKRLREVADPVGPENDRVIAEQVRRCRLHVCGWGAMGPLQSWAETPPPWDGTRRARRVLEILREAGAVPHALKMVGGNQPGHPLFLPGDLRPIPMEVAR